MRDLNKYENMFPAIVTTSVAIYRAFIDEFETVPHFFMGHSLGEYSALVASGLYLFADALQIVRLRGEISKNASEFGTMSIVNGLTEEELKAVFNELDIEQNDIFISCYNSKLQFSVSGVNEALIKLEKYLIKQKIEVTPILKSGPMHSLCMQKYLGRFKEYIEKIDICAGEYNVVSNVTGDIIGEATKEKIVNLLSEHIIKPVQWVKTLQCVNRFEKPLFIEFSPKNYISNMIR